MLHYVIVFFILSLVAGVLGFGGLASGLAGIAQFLALVFVVLFALSLVYSLGNNFPNQRNS